jgi:hypothetical protein
LGICETTPDRDQPVSRQITLGGDSTREQSAPCNRGLPIRIATGAAIRRYLGDLVQHRYEKFRRIGAWTEA